MIASIGVPNNTKARMCLLYLIAKMKSISKGEWLWRPIASLPQPVVAKPHLTLCARAMTRFLRYLCDEIPASFLVHSVNSVALWLQFLDSIQAKSMTEVDCKEQFNMVRPEWVVEDFAEATSWLAKKRRWKMEEIVWSIHKESKALDRAGKACAKGFWYVSHSALEKTLAFELMENNMCVANGQVWKRLHCIPMGGSFSAQAADLHCVWNVFRHRGYFRSLGTLQISPEGFPYWESEFTTALCQFRDNIMVASTAPPNAHSVIVSRVIQVLERAWGLLVKCDCGDVCTNQCLSHVVHAMGTCMVRNEEGTGAAHSHPSSLKPDWSLRLGPPLVSPTLAPKANLKSVFISILTNVVQHMVFPDHHCPDMATRRPTIRILESDCHARYACGY